ncbi:glycosyltransferase [Cyanobacterium aponinum UTEX 3222]|uniref:glycosyltransferase n=1 Tax=Cyanobacterium aponinum TaxID=379064 RepID=UPI002B4BF796|nr:glycosyltransferase [Cyanobacterium aponinum]WRL39337.1 glycosyltransferase [Cyanobacterium aponinum UTEX 3221]WRL40378.1 glycosyltransferase [Cyanobacterium aponinum UTEX 3222]
MKRFIIIDHSLQDLQGHHYECSFSIAESLQKLDFEVIIIANRNFPPSLYPKGIRVISEFEVDWFNNSTRKLTGVKKYIASIYQFFLNFSLGNLFNNYQEKIKYRIFILKTTKPKLSIFLEKVEGSFYRLNQWLKEDLKLLKNIPFNYTLLGILQTGIGVIKFIFSIITKIITNSLSRLIVLDSKSFTNSLQKIIEKLKLTSEDQVFIHTISIEQIEDLLYLLQSQKVRFQGDMLPIKHPHYHIMLRRDIDDDLVKNARGIGIKSCLELFYQSKLYPNKIEFYTDTEELVNRYNSLSPVKLKLIPVPFRQEKLKENIVKKDDNYPIHIVFLGDARKEKGYLYLPEIVENLWQDYLSNNKLKITIQSNFNNQDREIVTSRLILETYPEDKVKIIKNPLTTSAYYQLLNSADLLIIPYDNYSYRYRTSGVLTESLAAGKPVIVPKDTWLSEQIDENRGIIYDSPHQITDAIIKIINNLTIYQENAQKFSVGWCKKNSTDILIKTILSPILLEDDRNTFAISEIESKPLTHKSYFLLIVDGDKLLNLELNQQLIIANLEFLSSQNCQLSLIVYSLQSQLDKSSFENLINEYVSDYNLVNIYYIYKNITPCFLDNLDSQKYLKSLYHQENTFTKYLVDINSLYLGNDLLNYYTSQNIDGIILDSIASQILLNNIFNDQKIADLNIICQVSELMAYQSAIDNHHDIDIQELNQELILFSKAKVIIATKEYYRDKILNIHPHLEGYILPNIYPLTSHEKSWQKTKINSFIWGNNQDKYETLLKQLLWQNNNAQIDKNKVTNNNQLGKRIAILYPWQDILERKAGASQRVGLLIDYLRAKGHNIWLFTTGKEKDLFLDNARYTFFEQYSNNLSLVKEIYGHIYDHFYSFNSPEDLQNNSSYFPENIDSVMEDWRLSMYYQFRCDRTFEEQVKKVINWADIIILEYPFWSSIIAPLCQEAKVKLIITAHDIICEQISKNNNLYNILLTEEIVNLKKANQVVTVSEKDKEFLEQFKINSIVIPNPVQIHQPTEITDNFQVEKYKNNYPFLEENYCLFVGSGHFPNLEAVKEIKSIAHQYYQEKYFPECKFIVIGSCCQPENNNNFIALGKVDLDLLNIIYQKANLIIAPMQHGTGSSLKIMEAMSFSQVILGTNIAFRGYPIKNDIHALIEDNLSLYPQIIANCLKVENQDNMKKIGKDAFALASQYDYQYLYKKYENLFEI